MVLSMRNSCACPIAHCCACVREARESLSHMRNAIPSLYIALRIAHWFGADFPHTVDAQHIAHEKR